MVRSRSVASVLALTVGVLGFAVARFTARAVPAATWQRAALIYDSPTRTALQWQQHLMRVSATGHFTGQWLFDAVILTTRDIDGQDIQYDALTGSQLGDLLAQEFSDAAALNNAVAALAATYGPPPEPIEVALALPWLSPRDLSLTLPGATYNLSMAAQRMAVTTWYLAQVQSMAAAAHWSELSLYGVYDQREDASIAWDDPAYLQSMNAAAHSLGLSTIWVPYYDAPDAFSGASLGFSVTDIQPEYAFQDAPYEGVVNDSRLYSAGFKAAGQGQATEYELSSEGGSAAEERIAHQYLAVAQFTGASAYPQVFFTGVNPETPDLFDQVASASAVDPSEWVSYTDLANYLAGQAITNTDIGLPWSPVTTGSGALQQTWTPAAGTSPTSIRLDFNDPDPASPWRGQVTVSVTGPGGTRTAYAVRGGVDSVNPAYSSVYVPLPAAANGSNVITGATITVTRQAGRPWPNVMRLLAGTYDLPSIANGNSGATSSASQLTATPGTHADSQPTYSGYYAGKLTDGQVSPAGSWNWSGAMGWNAESGPFTVTIDLGTTQAIGSVTLITHADQMDGVNWPNDVNVSVGSTCAPQDTGIAGQSCQPAGTSGQAVLTSGRVTGGIDASDTAGTIALPLNSVTGQYVTISGVCSGWCLFDEMQVLSPSGAVISAGDSYTVTPMPTKSPGGGVTYGDDDYKLTDGTIVPAYGPEFADMLDGISAGTGGTVQATWAGPHSARTATVWMPAADVTDGVIAPSSVTIAWRNASGVWQPGVVTTPSASCGPSPCASLTLPAGAQVTGVKATFPGGGPIADWYMISQLSTQ